MDRRRQIGRGLAAVLLVASRFGCASDEGDDWSVLGTSGVDTPTIEPEGLAAMLDANRASLEELETRAANLYKDEKVRAAFENSGFQAKSYEELVAEERRPLSESLTSDEERTIRAMFPADTADAALTFTGRSVSWGDVPFHADDLLAQENEVVEKGRVCGAAGNSADGCVNSVYNAVANDGDRVTNTLSFRRPDTQTGLYLIVPDNAPQTLFDALVVATNRITGLPGGSLNCCTAGIDFIGATCSGSQPPCATGLLDPP